MSVGNACWCGSKQLDFFSDEYSECTVCGTLVSLVGLAPDKLVVQDDEQDFYGKQYWLDHQQEDLGFPNIYQRARNDLTERNLHWLKTLLKYRLPPATVLELGCSHGSFVALLQQVGFRATGLEMSPWVAEFGRNTFDITVLTGPIETQNLEPASYDVIALMDVLEHFPAPQATMRQCLKLLKPDGVLLIQTPQFREGVTHESLLSEKHRFIELLKSDEHLYLFSERSVRELFKRLGAEYITFEPAIFDCYDMFLAVSRQPMKTYAPDEIEQTLLSTANGRMVLAMLDLREREMRLSLQLQESEADRMARWEQIQTLTSMLKNKEGMPLPPKEVQKTTSMQLKTIAIDLTPVLPGGHNGGAKVFVLELIRRLSTLAPEINFILLTHIASHDELATLDGANVSRHVVVSQSTEVKPAKNSLRTIARPLWERIPTRYRAKLKQLIQKGFKQKASTTLLSTLQVDLLFCPFTAPTYHTPTIPTVCTFYDIQYKSYPQFFEPMDVLNREHTFKEACRYATMLAAISEYSRISAIKQGGIVPNRIRTTYLRMAQRINSPSKSLKDSLLSKLGLEQGQFLLYPANFWKHKNHELLFIAFTLARTEGLPDTIKLVCTGASDERLDLMQKAIARMGLTNHIIFPGYLSDDELAVLLHNSRGVVFPSLYEGFGLPVIEAMAAGIPVACSNVTSLPEVAGEAAILFDPRIPQQIASAIKRLAEDDELRSRSIELGYKRAICFENSDQMAQEYLDLFVFARNNAVKIDQLLGVYADGWASDLLHVSVSNETKCTAIEFELNAPEWLSQKNIHLLFTTPEGHRTDQVVQRGQTKTTSFPASAGDTIQIAISPFFVPADCTNSTDNRQLTLMVQHCALVLKDGTRKQLYPEAGN